MKARKPILALGFALALTLTACGSAGTASSAAASASSAKSNTLVYGSNDYTRINPALDEHGEINALLFDGLTGHDKDNQVVPRLAESWELDKATNTYTFHLRQDVTWHDGEKFTAEDVKFTIEAIQDPKNESENASNYEDVEKITVVDDHTVKFQLSAPNYAFLDYMTMAILPKHLLEGKDLQTDDYFRHPIGTGPYKLASWEAGQAITLERNESYFRGKANIQTIIFRIVPDSNAKALQLKSGELNLSQVTPKDAKTFADAKGQTVYEMKTSDYRGILYNFANDYWKKNADLIPAFNYAIDRQAMIDAVLLGAGEVAVSAAAAERLQLRGRGALRLRPGQGDENPGGRRMHQGERRILLSGRPEGGLCPQRRLRRPGAAGHGADRRPAAQGSGRGCDRGRARPGGLGGTGSLPDRLGQPL